VPHAVVLPYRAGQKRTATARGTLKTEATRRAVAASR
jgi:hypothetical protein